MVFLGKVRNIQLKSRMCVLLFLISLIILPLTYSGLAHSKSQLVSVVKDNYFTLAGHISHGVVKIDGDADFISQAWPGSGIEGAPYRIENLNITNTGSDHCIDIRNTRAYVLIKNCTLYGNSMDGIYLNNASNVIIEESDFINSPYGILMVDSSHNQVSRCNITNCGSGIVINTSTDNLVVNNTISVVGWRGIFLEHSDRNIVSLNNLSGGFHGVYLSYSDSNIISNNTCQSNGREAIYLTQGYNITVSGNICEGDPYYFTASVWNGDSIYLYENAFTGNGIKIEGYSLDIHATGNTINGQPIVFLSGVDGSDFSGLAGQIILLHCNNITVRNQVITNVGYGIQIVYCESILLKDSIIADSSWDAIRILSSPFTTIRNVTCYGNVHYGFYVYYSPSCIIEESICYDNGYDSIYIEHSDYSSIEDNLCYSNGQSGIYLLQSNYIVVTNNNCTDTNYGIYMIQNRGCNISSNMLADDEVGIHMVSSDRNSIYMNNLSNYVTEGILLYNSQMNIISNNTLTGNYGDVGLYVWAGSSDNSIANNTIQENNIGLHIEENSINNLVYWNQFIDNALYQVGDDGNYSAIHNNYYSDYLGADSNSDGIGDEPYPINGTADNDDPYPLMSPTFSPVVNHWTTPPSDQTLEYGLDFEYQVEQSGETIVAALINDTTHFSIDLTLTIRNTTNLVVGLYPLAVRARNIHGYYLLGIFTLNVSDTTAPSWINFPSTLVREYNELFYYQIQATDLSGIDHYELIADEAFYMNWAGNISQNSWLPVGEYMFEVRVFDIYDNYASGIFTLSIVDTILPFIDNYGDDRFFYSNHPEEVEWLVIEDNLISYEILIDGVLVSSGNETDNFNQIKYLISGLGVGVFNFTLIVTDTGGNTVSSTVIVTVAEQPISTSTTTTHTPTTTPVFGPGPDVLSIMIMVLGVVIVIAVIIVAVRRGRS